MILTNTMDAYEPTITVFLESVSFENQFRQRLMEQFQILHESSPAMAILLLHLISTTDGMPR